MKYDYLVVGAGLYGAVFVHEAIKRNKSCLVVEKRNHVAGNVYTESIENIVVHKYGAHIFHTSDEEVWQYVNQFSEFSGFINSPIALYKGRLYNLPFNMNTFNQIWGVITPEEAMGRIEEQRKSAGIVEPKNLEEQAISLVGRDIYEILIKGYTEKQWGRSCKELPASIINRIPVRFTFNNNYFNDKYQGIPVLGYTNIVMKMLKGADVRLDSDFLKERGSLKEVAKKIIFTGPIDSYFGYDLGCLNYRGLCFEIDILPVENLQGVAVVNYTDIEVPYTRIIEHKHFNFVRNNKTVISKEYPREWRLGEDPYYPVNNSINNKLYDEYRKRAQFETSVHFGGRLGQYRYLDMDKVIKEALSFARRELM